MYALTQKMDKEKMIVLLIQPFRSVFLSRNTLHFTIELGLPTKLVPLTLEAPSYFAGGANLKSPIGGFAYGIPRYSETPVEALDDAWPLTRPLVVLTALMLARRASGDWKSEPEASAHP